MQATPLFFGAVALVSVAGVVSGTAINTNPIQRAGIGMNEIARPAIDFESELSVAPELPDHYAMKTPEGHIEVAELSTRGLYAQRRFGYREAMWTPPEVDYIDDTPVAEPFTYGGSYVVDDAARAAVEVADTAQAAEQVMSEPAPAEGEARMIDVDQALAGA